MMHEHEHGHAHGHSYEQEQEFEHGHSHDHHHEHHHSHRETIELEWGQVELEAHVHDQATTVSMNMRPQGDCTIAFTDLVSTMQSIAKTSEEAGGIVGHIKAFARQDDRFVHASVTSADLAPTIDGDSSLSFGAEATIQLVAIVLLIDQADLLALCKESLERSLRLRSE
jgi:hypothetical protein